MHIPFASPFAQVRAPGIERRTAPGNRAPELGLPSTPPAPGFVLPPVPELPPSPPGPQNGASVFIREVRLEGNTVLSDAELEPIVRRYEGRSITTEELFRLRDELTLAYVERGYVNSGAVIPDQEVANGVVTVRLVEGHLDEIRFKGLRSLDPTFLERRVRLGAGPPLNVRELQQRLQLLLLDPAIERLNARLGPGARLGEGELDVDVAEARRLHVDARFANDRSPSVGEYFGELEATYLSLLGRGDPLRLRLGLSEGLREAELAYALPLTARDLRLHVAGEVTDADIVEKPFNQLDIESGSWNLELGLSHPLLERIEDEVRLELGIAREHSETSLLHEPFSFSPGVTNGKGDVTAIRFRQDWDHRGRETALAFRSTLSFGIDALGATVNHDDSPDSRFLAWLAELEAAHRLFGSAHQLVFRASLQLAANSLLPLEQYEIGGLNSVRGYRENLLVRDNGYAASLEYRLPLLRLPIPGWSQGPDEGTVYLAPFTDAGGGFNTDRPTPDPKVIYSIGTGLRWSPAPGFGLALYFGVPLKDVDEPEEKGLQDWGVHFELRVRLY